MIDPITVAWCRNASDEKAAANGCRFDVERAAYAVWWQERYCRLYEGEGYAGQPLILHGCHQCGLYGCESVGKWNDEAKRIGALRADRYAECVRLGHRIDWQYECNARIFGWVKPSERWQREIRRFRQAVIFVAKKNKKSSSLAGIVAYLTMGDGEPGQHVYIAAKDGKQARITCEHVKHLRSQSPEISEATKFNENTYRMSHAKSRSFAEPLSSSNSRTQNSKEGLNGSVCIDEVHVVDRQFAGVLKGAGISRSEPLQIEVSTAGSDPESYGKERFDLALEVIDGRREQENLFAAIYAAPQNLTPAQLAADPLKYARMANPAMGHTVDPDELMADYNASKMRLASLATWMMYRANVWQSSATPWLDMLAWGRNKREFSEEFFVGKPVSAALDLAKTRDTCSLVLTTQDEDTGEYYQKAYYWLPRERAEDLKDKVAYLQWAEDGWITLTEGNVTDYNVIRREIIRLDELLDIASFTYDDHYAAELIQGFLEGVERGGKIEQSPIFDEEEVCAFAQSMNAFAGPTDDYEAQVKSGKLFHDGNPCMTWQAGCAVVKTNANLDKRPVKPAQGDVKTIDGVVAGVMSLGMMEKAKANFVGGYVSGSLRD